jgi:hypothetical protein
MNLNLSKSGVRNCLIKERSCGRHSASTRAIGARVRDSRGCLEYLALPVPPCKMPPNTSPAIPETIPTLQEIRTCSPADIISICSSITELDSQLPHDYLAEIDDNERVICLRASLICWRVTQGKQVPRKMQLQAILADRLNQDSLVSAGTGSGKTLPIAINILLDDPANSPITLTISPLTRLQSSQVESFGERYGIKTFAINQYTPRDAAWWAVNCLLLIFLNACTNCLLGKHTQQ